MQKARVMNITGTGSRSSGGTNPYTRTTFKKDKTLIWFLFFHFGCKRDYSIQITNKEYSPCLTDYTAMWFTYSTLSDIACSYIARVYHCYFYW